MLTARRTSWEMFGSPEMERPRTNGIFSAFADKVYLLALDQSMADKVSESDIPFRETGVLPLH